MNFIGEMVPVFFLVLCRITGFFLIVPIFSARNTVPIVVRLGIAVLMSWIVVVTWNDTPQMAIDATYVMRIVQETIIGLVFGFVAYLFFVTVQLAGAIIDVQVGFGFAQIVDPVTEASMPMFGGFKYAITMLLFVSLNAHHYLILGILESYALVPLIGASIWSSFSSGTVANALFDVIGAVTLSALQMAAPIVVAMFLIDAALGILTKIAPQFNIFVIGIPIKIGVGLLLTLLLVPSFVGIFSSLFDAMFGAMHALLQGMRG
jgi:flagellar biosynthetic protein FliR